MNVRNIDVKDTKGYQSRKGTSQKRTAEEDGDPEP
jgi:hypothetical protein